MRRLRCTSFWTLALVMVGASARVSAQIELDVPEGCGTEAELRSELARLIGVDASVQALPRRLTIVRTDPGDYALSLVLPSDTRALRDADCHALFKTAALMAAAAVDPSIEDPSAEKTEPEPPTPPPTVLGPKTPAQPVVTTAPTPPAPTVKEARNGAPVLWHVGAAVGGGAMLAMLPKPSPLLELSGTLGFDAIGIELAARYLGGTEERSTAAYGVSVQGIGGRLAAFYDVWPFARLQAGMAVDRLSGRGLGSGVQTASGSAFAWAVQLDALALPVSVGDFRLWLGLSGHYALLRPSFEITGYGEVYRIPNVGGSGVLRLGWQFY